MAKILITGSSGFLGGETYSYMKAKGHSVFGVDLVPSATTDCVMDIRNWTKQNDDAYDTVCHFAAIVKGRQNIENNYIQMMENVDIDRSVFEWAIPRVSHIMYPSSSAVYPVELQSDYHNVKLLSEPEIDFKTQKIGVSDHIYGWTKLTAERMLWEMSLNSDMKITIFRPFSGYGKSQSLDYPFPNLVNEVKKNPNVVPVWGDGNQIRDFIHISDLLKAFDFSIHDDHKFLTVNLGSGIGTSFNNLVRLISSTLYGIDNPAIVNDTKKPVGVSARVADIALQKKLGLLPTVSLIDGIKTFI